MSAPTEAAPLAAPTDPADPRSRADRRAVAR